MMKAEVGNEEIRLFDVESPDAVMQYLNGHGFDAVSSISVKCDGRVIRIQPPKKVSSAWLEDAKIARAIELGFKYGSIDGGHHKMWVIDQMIRILTGCPTVTLPAIDANGEPYRYEDLGESDRYRAFVAARCMGEDGPDSYEWDPGIAP